MGTVAQMPATRIAKENAPLSAGPRARAVTIVRTKVRSAARQLAANTQDAPRPSALPSSCLAREVERWKRAWGRRTRSSHNASPTCRPVATRLRANSRLGGAVPHSAGGPSQPSWTDVRPTSVQVTANADGNLAAAAGQRPRSEREGCLSNPFSGKSRLRDWQDAGGRSPQHPQPFPRRVEDTGIEPVTSTLPA